MQICAVRMGVSMLARIDTYGAWLKARHPGLRVERADAVRDLMLKALALVEGNGPAGPDDAGSGPVFAPEQDLTPNVEDRSASSQGQPRTPDRKRPTAAKGDASGAAGVR